MSQPSYIEPNPLAIHLRDRFMKMADRPDLIESSWAALTPAHQAKARAVFSHLASEAEWAERLRIDNSDITRRAIQYALGVHFLGTIRRLEAARQLAS